MAYTTSGRLGMETASKLGHLMIVNNPWVKSLIDDFESIEMGDSGVGKITFQKFVVDKTESLKSIWAVDGSFVPVRSNPPTGKEVAFVKTALMYIDFGEISKLDQENPHPMLLQDIMKDSAIFHSTVFPLRNVKSSLGNNKDAIRNIVYHSLKQDQEGSFFETLKWLVFKKWLNEKPNSPSFECPHCGELVEGFTFDSEEMLCSHCSNSLFLTDMIGFHLDMEEDSASDAVASSYMLITETLMLFTPIRLLWGKNMLKFSNTLFIKDGPLTLRSQYAKFVPLIREFIEYTRQKGYPINLIGQEKTGVFRDHLSFIERFVSPKDNNEDPTYFVLTHEYVHKEVYRMDDLKNPYGKRTNYGEKVYVKVDPTTSLVLNIPTGTYNDNPHFPEPKHLLGLVKILSTLPGIISRSHEGALYPIELANGIASLSNYPSAKILQNFIETN
nr:hypothetical protein [uncultured Trichococcus sp.]